MLKSQLWILLQIHRYPAAKSATIRFIGIYCRFCLPHWERSATFSQHKLTCSGCKICTAVHFSCRLCVILTNLIHSAGTVYSPCEHTLPVLVLTLLLWETVVSVPIILILWGSPVIGPRHFHFIVTVLERWPAQIYILLPCSVHSVFLG